MILSESVYAYLAGIVDGEGHIGVYGKRTVVLEVSMCHLPTIEWLALTFGGAIYTPVVPRENARQYWKWSLPAGGLREHLPHVLPFSITKKEHIQIALELLELRAVRLGPIRNQPERQDELTVRLREINRRGRQNSA